MQIKEIKNKWEADLFTSSIFNTYRTNVYMQWGITGKTKQKYMDAWKWISLTTFTDQHFAISSFGSFYLSNCFLAKTNIECIHIP